MDTTPLPDEVEHHRAVRWGGLHRERAAEPQVWLWRVLGQRWESDYGGRRQAHEGALVGVLVDHERPVSVQADASLPL